MNWKRTFSNEFSLLPLNEWIYCTANLKNNITREEHGCEIRYQVLPTVFQRIRTWKIASSQKF